MLSSWLRSLPISLSYMQETSLRGSFLGSFLFFCSLLVIPPARRHSPTPYRPRTNSTRSLTTPHPDASLSPLIRHDRFTLHTNERASNERIPHGGRVSGGDTQSASRHRAVTVAADEQRAAGVDELQVVSQTKGVQYPGLIDIVRGLSDLTMLVPKIKCNRLRPSCEACQVFQCPCIYGTSWSWI